MSLFDRIKPKPVVAPPPAGILHYRQKNEEGESRAHLRIDPDGRGFLMVNASRVYHFNPTAAFMAYLALEQVPEKQAVRAIMHAYNVHKTVAGSDYAHMAAQIHLITAPAYEKLSGLIRSFSGLSGDEVSALKEAGRAAGQAELTNLLDSLTPDDAEDLIAAIPVLSVLPAGTQKDLLRQFQSGNHEKLAGMVKTAMNLDPRSAALFREITAVQPADENMEPFFETVLPFSKTDLQAPYRMDLALTYRCNNACHHCYNPANRRRAELTTEEWKSVIDELWEAGVPHIIFTGGEPTLRPDLPELIAHAERNGQITGINTNGRRLSDAGYVCQLVEAGLDHIQITLESHDEHIHDEMVNLPGAWRETTAGIRNALNTRLYVMTNTTMLTNNYRSLRDTLQFLADLGVRRVGLNALIYSGQGASVGTGLREKDLPELLTLARGMTEKNKQKLTWYTPTQYCHFDPVLFDYETLGVKGCTAALYNMCVEPDGKVLPCQSYYQPIGEMLKQSWDEIWNHDLAVSLRSRAHVAEECQDCALLSVCGGGCPLAAQAGKLEAPRAIHFVDA